MVVVVGLQSLMVFVAYALLFSSGRIVTMYLRLGRWFEGVFAVAFGLAGISLLTRRLG